MIAIDVLKVLLSTNNNQYLLILQDYINKWVDAIPMPDQTAERITTALIKFFYTYGPPQILHSDQGTNFESSIYTNLTGFWHKKITYHPLPPSRRWYGGALQQNVNSASENIR